MFIDFILYVMSRTSLLDMARFIIYRFVPFVLITLMLTILFGCSVVEVVPRHEKLPKIQINSDYADDIEVKLKDDSIVFKFEWEL